MRDRGRQPERRPVETTREAELYFDLASRGITGEAAIEAVKLQLQKEAKPGDDPWERVISTG